MTISCTKAPSDFVGDTGVFGTVVRDGRPVEGAYVRLTGSAGEFVAEIRTQPDGEFKFYVVPGAWTLVCLAPGAAREEQLLPLTQGELVKADISLSAGLAEGAA